MKEKKENLKQRAYLNSVTSILDYGTKLIVNFFITPIIVNGLGSMLFGVWQILGQFTSYTNMGDIRAAEVLKWAIAQDRDKKVGEELRQYITATFLLTCCILPIILTIGSILVWYSPQITQVSPEYYSLVRMTSLFLILALVINKIFSIFESILRGMNLGYKRMGLRAVIFVVGGGLKALVVYLGYGLILLALVQVFISLVIGVTIYSIVKSHVPWFGLGKINFKKSFTFFKVSGWFLSWTGTRLLLLNTDKVLLGYFAGPILVTQYVITKYLAYAVQGFVQNVVHGVIPGIGKLYGNGRYEKLIKVRKNIMHLTWIVVMLIGSLIIIFNKSFIILWIGETSFAGQYVNIFIVITIVQYIFIQNDSVIINTTLDISHKVYIGLLSAVISIFIMIVLIPKLEIIGLCIGMISGRMIMSIGYPWLIYKKTLININYKNIPLRPILTSLMMGYVMYNISELIIIDSWIYLITSLFISTIILAPVICYTGLNSNDRQELYGHIKNINILNN